MARQDNAFWFANANFVLMFPLLLLIRTPKKSSVTTPPISAD